MANTDRKNIRQSRRDAVLPRTTVHGSLGVRTGNGSGNRRVSIHAPTWGATRGGIVFYNCLLFQSTLPRGERRSGPVHRPRTRGFNPRSHVRSDIAAFLSVSRLTPFQSTLPCGERLMICQISVNNSVFQSTLPCGERRYRGLPLSSKVRFQSTLPRRERLLAHALDRSR